MRYQKMSLAQVKAYVRKHGTWHGLMYPSKMIFSELWHRYEINLSMNSNGDLIDDRTNKAFVITLNQWLYYNANYEMGYYPHYYMIVRG